MKNPSGKAAFCREIPSLTQGHFRPSDPGYGGRQSGRGLPSLLMVPGAFRLWPTGGMPGWGNDLPHAAESGRGGGDERPWRRRRGDPDSPPW